MFPQIFSGTGILLSGLWPFENMALKSFDIFSFEKCVEECQCLLL